MKKSVLLCLTLVLSLPLFAQMQKGVGSATEATREENTSTMKETSYPNGMRESEMQKEEEHSVMEKKTQKDSKGTKKKMEKHKRTEKDESTEGVSNP